MTVTIKPWICTPCLRSLRRAACRGQIFSRSPKRSRAYMSITHGHDRRPFRMAVIGSGPAGFYAAYKVMSKVEGSVIDMYEQLPVPYGLVRFGVAPDHPEVKNCEDKFEEVAASPRFNFIGNLAVGDQHGSIPLRSLLPHYDAILFAYGASQDRRLGLPGEDSLKGIYSARAFVGWYNGLPEYSDLAPDLTQGDEAVIIGQGNVALDVARILLQDPRNLRSTDITENALEALHKCRVKRVSIVGRRGPLQAAFTIKELRELVKLPSVAFKSIPSSLIPEDISKLPRASRRIMEILKKAPDTPMVTASKSWSLDFCLSPRRFNPSSKEPSTLGSLSLERTLLKPGPFEGDAKAVGSGEMVDLPSSLAFRSIGYKSEALPGFTEAGIRFNESLGVLPNDGLGRVIQKLQGEQDGVRSSHFPGLYCAGWVKRGPTGVIASTMLDAFSTADAVAEDWYSRASFLNDGKSTGLGWQGVRGEAERRGCRRVSWQDWQKIDDAEKLRGQTKGKAREKFTKVADMLAVLD